jgi:TrmH family RNA methyltransferase
MERIISNQNARVKAWAKLATKKGRQENHTYLLDGLHLVEEAVKAGAKFHAISCQTYCWYEYSTRYFCRD